MDLYEGMLNGRVRRYLTVRDRVIVPGGVYHITHRAPGRELVFIEEKDYLYMLFLMKETAAKFFWNVFGFSFIPNHFHLLLRINESNLSLGMKSMCERYAKFFNKKYERKGPVFSRPYRSALCLDDVYLLSVLNYIHINPLKAKLCKEVSDYRWSSIKLYFLKDKKSFIDSGFILGMLHKDLKTARKNYAQLLYGSIFMKYRNIIDYPSHIDYIKDKTAKLLATSRREKDPIEAKAEEFKARGRLRKPEQILGRKYLIEQMFARGFRAGEIAHKLGISRAALDYTLNLTK